MIPYIDGLVKIMQSCTKPRWRKMDEDELYHGMIVSNIFSCWIKTSFSHSGFLKPHLDCNIVTHQVYAHPPHVDTLGDYEETQVYQQTGLDRKLVPTYCISGTPIDSLSWQVHSYLTIIWYQFGSTLGSGRYEGQDIATLYSCTICLPSIPSRVYSFDLQIYQSINSENLYKTPLTTNWGSRCHIQLNVITL